MITPTMIEANPHLTIAAIWTRLVDEHGVTVACPTLPAYVASRPGHEDTGQD